MMEPLSGQRVQSYLRHLGASEPSEPTLDYLVRLISAHLERVTFENLDVLLERRISLDADAVLGKVTGRGRGGYCYELNSLFARLLLALGNGVCLRAARLRLLTPDDSPKRTALTHMLLLVEPTNGHRYIVDIGMAQCGLHRALPLEGDVTPFRVRSMDVTEALEVALPTSDGGWKALYVVEPYDLDWLDFDTFNWSPTRGVVEKRVMRDENDILEILRDEFGLNLNAADDEAPLRVRLRGLLDNLIDTGSEPLSEKADVAGGMMAMFLSQ
ncbi:hypothetical protein HPB49_013551 [Dermacentor silvarum]|uniref:Uncharacterized protein n=1 Tax=Dermacentor silvarum TaxID=543639 RepID=A0ACB8C9I9_DERSI|nr:hypothetical protein HPB49_013551 [Dermacentor silvarum]